MRGMVVLGTLIGPYGVNGWLNSILMGLDYDQWTLDICGIRQVVGVVCVRRHGHGIVAKLDCVNKRNSAELLIQATIMLPTEALPAADEYYWYQLSGILVVKNGKNVGRVDHLLETGANDVLVVIGDGKERLLPYLPHVTVDLSANIMTVE